MRAENREFLTERMLAASGEFVLASRMRARLPGHQLKSAAILMVAMRDVRRVPMVQHPCYQLHSALDGGTCKKHVHVSTPGHPCVAVQGTYKQLHTRYTNANSY